MGIAHAFAALISHLTVVCGYDGLRLGFLLSPGVLVKENRGAVSAKLSALVGVV